MSSRSIVTLAELCLSALSRCSFVQPRRCWLSESQPTREVMQSIYGRLVTQNLIASALNVASTTSLGLANQMYAVGIGSQNPNNACLCPFAFDSNRLVVASTQPPITWSERGAASCHPSGSERSRAEKNNPRQCRGLQEYVVRLGKRFVGSQVVFCRAVAVCRPWQRLAPGRRRPTAWHFSG